jgi:hypothetical protein
LYVRRRKKKREPQPVCQPPGSLSGLERKIQLLYVNGFASIWEYKSELERDGVPWTSIIGPRCPLCGKTGCYREIPGYRRRAATLFPAREGTVEIARFQCRRTGRTFSMLPWQLVPYHRFTVDSLVLAVLLAAQCAAEGGSGLEQAAAELPVEADVSPWQLRRWLTVVVRGLRRSHGVLSRGADLSEVRSGIAVSELLAEVTGYVAAFSGRSRGPPGRHALDRLLRHHRRLSSSFLVGVASQHRGG